jgi:4-hydroxybenzoate polyprenyltransferase
VAAGASSWDGLAGLGNILFGFYFLFPANLLVYGLSGIFGYETDKLDDTKAGDKLLTSPANQLRLFLVIAAVNFPFIAAALVMAPLAFPAMALFLLLSVFYSTPPIRAREIPIVDSAFNALYVMPGVFAYRMLSAEYPSFELIAAGILWAMATHAYSAIPKIETDSAAGLNTVATLLGPQGTHLYCLAAYLGSALLLMADAPVLGLTLGTAYTTMTLVSLAVGRGSVFSIYRIFPLVNMLTGLVLLCYIVLDRSV